MSILGSLKRLEGGRVVFVGASDKPEYADHRYIAFKDSQGNDTTLALSPEAAAALRQLLDDELGADEFPFTMHWELVPTESIIRTEVREAT